MYSDPFYYPLKVQSEVAISIYFGEVPEKLTSHAGSRTFSFFEEGNKIDSTIVIVELTKKNYHFINMFQILPVGGFENIKNKYGIEISGLIGNDFLSKYEFIMDFKNLKYYIFKDETNLKRRFFKNIKKKRL